MALSKAYELFYKIECMSFDDRDPTLIITIIST